MWNMLACAHVCASVGGVCHCTCVCVCFMCTITCVSVDACLGQCPCVHTCVWDMPMCKHRREWVSPEDTCPHPKLQAVTRLPWSLSEGAGGVEWVLTRPYGSPSKAEVPGH